MKRSGVRGGPKRAGGTRGGIHATGEKESIGIPLYGYANDGRKRGAEEKKVKWIPESETGRAAVVRGEGLRRGKSGRSEEGAGGGG